MTGYELSQFLASSTGWLWSATHSQIYPALAKLREQGLIEGGIEGVRGGVAAQGRVPDHRGR